MTATPTTMRTISPTVHGSTRPACHSALGRYRGAMDGAAHRPGRPVYESWVERQIREAIERGEFDNLPGAGQPLRSLNGRHDENWWITAKLEREGLKPPLPTSLALRREALEIGSTVADVRTEEQVREIVRDLNHRIVDARRRGVDGPRIFVRTVSV